MKNKKIKGYAYLDLAISIALLGIFALFFFKLNIIANDNSNNSHDINTIHHIQNSIESYAFTHSRLPCPSENNQGIALSNCETVREGYVPYQTLGIYDDAAKSIKYILTNPAEDYNTDLTKDKMNVLKIAFLQNGQPTQNALASDYINAKPFVSKSDHFVDFCVALGDTSPGKEKTNAIAYTLIKENILEPILTGNVHETLKSSLFENFNCSRIISASARTHINIATAIETIRRSAEDGAILNKIAQDEENLNLSFGQLSLIWNSLALTNAALDLTRSILNVTSISMSAMITKSGQLLEVVSNTLALAYRGALESYYIWSLKKQEAAVTSINAYNKSYNNFLNELEELNALVSDNAFHSIYSGLDLPMNENN